MKILAALVLAIALPAMAQQSRKGEIVNAARIYGYNISEGNWTHSQTACAAMPQTVLLHYVRDFPDGTESVFTALVPRSEGRVRIVPVLYHGATPFVPAARNPRNYRLFNSITAAAGSGNQHWFELATCYAEMTGGIGASAQDPTSEIAGQPSPTVSFDVRDKTVSVTVAQRDSSHSYLVWSIGFHRSGRIASVQAEQESVYAPKKPRSTRLSTSSENQAESAAARPMTQPLAQSTIESAHQPTQQQTSESQPESLIPPAHTSSVAAPVATISTPQAGSASPSQPGWKFIPDAPPPQQKFVPDPLSGSDQSANPRFED